MKVRLAAIAALAAAVATAFTIAPAASAAPVKRSCTDPLQTALSGNAIDPSTGQVAGTYNLCYTLQKFTNTNSQLTAVGKVTGTVTNTVTGQTQTVKQTVSGAAAAASTCTILDLTIQPIDLNLLGLMVHTDTIHLLITAQQGGGLLGDLLCSLDNLLNNNGGLSQIIDLLNQIIGQL